MLKPKPPVGAATAAPPLLAPPPKPNPAAGAAVGAAPPLGPPPKPKPAAGAAATAAPPLAPPPNWPKPPAPLPCGARCVPKPWRPLNPAVGEGAADPKADAGDPKAPEGEPRARAGDPKASPGGARTIGLPAVRPPAGEGLPKVWRGAEIGPEPNAKPVVGGGPLTGAPPKPPKPVPVDGVGPLTGAPPKPPKPVPVGGEPPKPKPLDGADIAH